MTAITQRQCGESGADETVRQEAMRADDAMTDFHQKTDDKIAPITRQVVFISDDDDRQ